MDHFRFESPYCDSFKISSEHRGLIMQHLIVRKLTRRELEDKYLRLIDENYELKQEKNMQKDKIKILTTKVLRLSKDNSRLKSRELLFFDNVKEVHEKKKIFNMTRPASSSAIPSDTMRISTPFVFTHRSDLTSDRNIQRALKDFPEIPSKECSEGFIKFSNNSARIQEIEHSEKATQIEPEADEPKRHENVTQNDGNHIKIYAEIAELHEKIKELNEKLKNVVEIDVVTRKMKECQAEHGKLLNTLDEERNKIKVLEDRSNEVKALQKVIEDFKQELIRIKRENVELSTQCENHAALNNEVSLCKQHMNELKQLLEVKEKRLQNEQAGRMSIEHSQEELLKKMKEVQRENDEFAVRLEGLKTENEDFLRRHKQLESRIQFLEGHSTEQQKKTFYSIQSTSADSTILKSDKTTSTLPSSHVKRATTSKEIKFETNEEKENFNDSHDQINMSTSSAIAFADTFSRSVSKDDKSIDDPLDTRTFSIEQESDPEGISELLEDNEIELDR